VQTAELERLAPPPAPLAPRRPVAPRVLPALIVLMATVLLWMFGLPPRSLGVFAAAALLYWALLDRADRVFLGGLLLTLEAAPAWIEGLPHPWVGVVVGGALMASRSRRRRRPGSRACRIRGWAGR
jgi:hypothetical protein